MKDIQSLKSLATQIRRDVLRMTHGAQSGHPGGSLGCADLLTVLYFRVMRHNPNFDMKGKDEDLFFLSNGHISPVWYSALARAGYFPVEELKTFRFINTRLQGHPTTHEGLPGIRIASGSLGQGLSVAIGAAQAKKLDEDGKLVYVLMGDGEQQEGQIWEAAMYAAHHQVDNLIAFVDLNNRQIDGDTDKVLSLLDLGAKYRAFGWEVLEAEGNDIEKLLTACEQAKATSGKGKPVVVMMKTEMGYPVDFMMGTHKWHGVAPNDEQLANALSQLQCEWQDY
jgi:transketolase